MEYPALAKVTGSKVALRDAPSLSGDRMGQNAGGELAVMLGEEKDSGGVTWRRVMICLPGLGQPVAERWINGRYLTLVAGGEWQEPVSESQGQTFGDFYDALLRAVGTTPEEAEAKFGTPSSRKEETVPGRHNPGDEVHFTTLVYPGLELAFFRAGENQGLLVLKAASGEYLLGRELRVGADGESVFRELGIPQFQEGSTFGWTDDSGYVTLLVTFSDAVVSTVEFNSDLD